MAAVAKFKYNPIIFNYAVNQKIKLQPIIVKWILSYSCVTSSRDVDARQEVSAITVSNEFNLQSYFFFKTSHRSKYCGGNRRST